MSDGTNPNMVSLGRVFSEVRDMRKENREEHQTITKTLNVHSIKLACLEAKWGTFWKIVKYAGPVMGVVIGAAVAVNWWLSNI